VEHSGLVAELLRGHEREVAVAAGLRLRRVVEGPHGVARDARVVPAVVVVLAAQPVVLVHRREEPDLVARRAELRRSHERLHERLPVEGRLHPDQELVDFLEHLVARERERVLLALLDDVTAVAAQVLDLGDRVAGHAGEALLRLELVVRERRHRRLAHLAREEDDGVVAARAPLRLLAPDAVRHQLDGAAVERVVERGEAVGALFPALEGVRMAFLAVLVRGELLPVEKALVERLGRGEEELRVAVRVHDALRRLLELVEARHHEEERGDGAAPLREHPEVQLVDGGAPVTDERDERRRDREDVREVDRAVRERRPLEGHRDARADAQERERHDRDAGDLRAAVPDVREHPRAVREGEDEEGNRDQQAQYEVHEQHRHEERGVLREGDEVDRVRRHEAERHEKDRVEPPLPGMEDALRADRALVPDAHGREF
jgi:hypothetical protein